MPPTVKPVKYAVFVGFIVVCLIGLVLLWQRHEPLLTPEKSFGLALQATLTQKGIACQVDQVATATSKQVIRLDVASGSKLQSITTLKRQDTTVTTEQIDTKDATYVRYTAISSKQKHDYGAAINTWSKDALSKDGMSLFNSAKLGLCIVPLGDLNSTQLASLAGNLQNGKAFKTDFTKVKTAKLGGEAVRVYDVTVQAEPYVELMKSVAKIGGISYLEKVKASDYAEKSPEAVKFYIDTKTNRLLKIENPARKRTVAFSEYGSVPKITVPAKTISPAALQKRLQGQ